MAVLSDEQKPMQRVKENKFPETGPNDMEVCDLLEN